MLSHSDRLCCNAAPPVSQSSRGRWSCCTCILGDVDGDAALGKSVPWRRMKKLCVSGQLDEGLAVATLNFSEKNVVAATAAGRRLDKDLADNCHRVRKGVPAIAAGRLDEDFSDNLQVFAATAAKSERTGDSKFWKVGADPFGDRQPYPILIWNRRAYDVLQGLIEDGLKQGYSRFILLGTAGSGKSFFSIVWMLKLAAKGGCKIVIKLNNELYILDFCDKSHPTVSGPLSAMDPLVVAAVRVKSNWLIIDGEQGARLTYKCKILQACSTKPGNFEEFGKHSETCRFYLPVWSKREINEFLDDFELYRDEYQAMDINDKASALKLYDRLGGVARYVLQRKKSSEGLKWVNLAVAQFVMDVDQAMQVLAGGFVPDVSEQVVHIFCKQGDYENPVFDFASKHVKKALVEQVQLASDVKIMALLKSTVYEKSVGSVWGCCFKEFVHRALAHGGQVCVKKVTESGSGPIQNVTIEPHQVVMLDDIGKLKQMVARGIYVKPEDLNFPVADSFMGENIIIQVFKRLSGKHGYNVNGLLKIDKCLQLEKYELWSCVPPELFEKTKYQRYTGKDPNEGTSEVSGRAACGGRTKKSWNSETLKVLSKFEQFVVLIDYNCT